MYRERDLYYTIELRAIHFAVTIFFIYILGIALFAYIIVIYLFYRFFRELIYIYTHICYIRDQLLNLYGRCNNNNFGCNSFLQCKPRENTFSISVTLDQVPKFPSVNIVNGRAVD